MLGAIDDATTVRIVPPPPDGPAVGDVVMAGLPDGRLVVHRVRKREGSLLVLRGDALLRRDPAIEMSAVVGVVPDVAPASLRSLARRVLA